MIPPPVDWPQAGRQAACDNSRMRRLATCVAWGDARQVVG